MDSGWDSEAVTTRDKLRTKYVVRGFVTSSEFLNPEKHETFEFNRRFS